MNRDDNDDETPDEQRHSTDLESGLSVDAMLNLLAHAYRRGLLQYFVDSTNDISTLDEVTTRLVARERKRTDDRPTRDRVETELVHVHLPKLSSAGILEYDSRSREIRYRRHDRLESLLVQLLEWMRDRPG